LALTTGFLSFRILTKTPRDNQQFRLLTGVGDTGDELSPVSTIPLKSSSPVLPTPVSAICLDFASFTGIVDTSE
jgi:hypothetical protein